MIKKIKSWLALTSTTKSIAITSVVALIIVLAATSARCGTTKTSAVNPSRVSTSAQSLEPSAVVISNFAVNPVNVNVGDSVNIVANVTNTSGSEGLYNADLRINNTNVASKALIIPAGVTQTLNFKVPTNIPGTYEVAFGGLKGIFTVVDYAVNQVKPVQLNNNNSNSTTGAASSPSCCSPTQSPANGSSAGGCCGTPSPAPSTSIFPKKASGGCCGL